jgi:hypothetical protein
MQRINQNTFEIIQDIIARNLEIDREAIDLEFKFHYFIDRMAEHRQKLSGAEDLLDYIEAANIYIDFLIFNSKSNLRVSSHQVRINVDSWVQMLCRTKTPADLEFPAFRQLRDCGGQ